MNRLRATLYFLTATLCFYSTAFALSQDPNAAVWNFSSVEDCIRQCIDTAGKGDNSLSDRINRDKIIFPAEQRPRFEELKRWLRINGQSIYGAKAGSFRDLPFGRSTTKDNCIYLHVFDWPKDGQITLPGLMTTLTDAVFLKEPNCPIGITADVTDVILAVPDSALDNPVTVIRLEFDQPPQIICGPEIFPQQTEFTRPIDISFSDFAVNDSYRIYYTLDGTDPNTRSLYYEEPFTLRDSATISCRKITRDGVSLSPVSRKTYIKKTR